MATLLLYHWAAPVRHSAAVTVILRRWAALAQHSAMGLPHCWAAAPMRYLAAVAAHQGYREEESVYW
jgi:hypothetical protein